MITKRPRNASIFVHNSQRVVRVNLARLEKFAEAALRRCLRIQPGKAAPLTRLRDVNVVLVSDRRIAQLHRRFLNTAGPTDVITFQHGEIFISTETAHRNARRFHSSCHKELELYIVHGLLHLLGFDDKHATAARKMELAQQKIVEAARR